MDKCENCKKKLHIPNWKRKAYSNRPVNKHFFCDRQCYEKYWSEIIAPRFKGSGNVRWDKNKVFKKCFVCRKKFRVTGKRKQYGRFCSRSCVSTWNFTGSRNPKWTGGLPREKRTELPEYEIWRKEVYKRDRWKCKICRTEGGKIVAHHIKTYKHFPKDRFKVENGLTLCRACHTKLHTIHKKVIDFKEILRDYTLNTER